MPVKLFDANFYKAANPDLTAAGLTTDAQLLSHFQNNGLNEGRDFSPFVNLNFYRSSNSDLAHLNNQQAFEHLQNYGVAEARQFSPLVDLKFYQASNSDLVSFNNEQVFKHLQDYGVSEGRDFSRFFDFNFYRSRNSDLVAAGLSNSQLLQHFEIHGLNEGRASSPDFNVSYYLSNNSDLVAAGFNYKQAYDHFLLYGFKEGRLGVAPSTQQWIQQVGTATSRDVAVDSTGNVYITGYTNSSLAGTHAGGRDGWVAKYDTRGNRLWIQQFGTSSDDDSENVAVDSAGNVYLTGETIGSLGGINIGNEDTWLAKYDTSGNRLWIQQFGTSDDDSSTGITVDITGNVYISGVVSNFSAETNTGDTYAWLAKYNSSGNQQWLEQLNTSGYDSYAGVAVDPAGNVYTTGQANSNDNLVAKYDSSGNSLWIQRSSAFTGFYSGVAVDSAGNDYITGRANNDALVSKYDSSGKQQWIQFFDHEGDFDSGIDIAVDSADSVYILVESRFSMARGNSVVKYDTSGYTLGTKYSIGTSVPYPDFVGVDGIAVDSASNLYLTESKNGDAWVAKYS